MDILLGRQSILDREQKLVAYELLFRSIDSSPISCDTEATASVIANTLSMMSIDNILGNKKGFINIGIDILRQGLLDIIPPGKFVIEILETQLPSPELLKLIQTFKRKNYIFALDDFIINEEQIEYWKPILQEVHIVKVDVIDTNLEDLEKKTKLLSPFKVALLAEKVETREMFDICFNLGYSYFQGFFFTKPEVLKGQDLSPSVRGIFDIIKKIQQDADISDVEQTIKLYPELIIALLKIVNSASVSPIQEITSIKQAIALLGNKSLIQWLLLLLYSQRASQNHPLNSNPLFIAAAQRGKMMETLLSSVSIKKPAKSQLDEAFLIGLLSLGDALLGIPLEQVIVELHLSNTISKTLLNGEGQMGEILSLIKYLEEFNAPYIQTQAQKLKISAETINESSLKSQKFAKNLASQI